MGITIGVMAQGMMGAGVGRRLHESGAEVRTLLSGRSAASAERARAAGMRRPPTSRRCSTAPISSCRSCRRARPRRWPGGWRRRSPRSPRSRSMSIAMRSARKPPSASPRSSRRPAPLLSMAGSSAGRRGRATARRSTPPVRAAGQTAVLRDWGIDWRVIDGADRRRLRRSRCPMPGSPRASTAIASAMMLGAARFGCAEALIAELSREPAGDARLARAASRGCTTRPIAGSPRWRRSPISSERTRRRATSTRRSPASTSYLAAAEAEKRTPAPTTPVKALDRVLRQRYSSEPKATHDAVERVGRASAQRSPQPFPLRAGRGSFRIG